MRIRKRQVDEKKCHTIKTVIFQRFSPATFYNEIPLNGI